MPLRTALGILLDDAAPEIAEARAELAPELAARIPLHLTLLYPFVERSAVTPELVAEVRAFFGGFPPLAFDLARIDVFPGVVTYAAPEPGGELVDLMRAVWARFPETPAYDGAFADPVPHATLTAIGNGDEEAAVAAVRVRVEPLLPVACAVDHAWLVEEFEPDRWRGLERLPFGAGAVAAA